MTANLHMAMRKITLGALFSSLLLYASVYAEELDGTLKKIKTSGTFTIGYRGQAPHFSFSGPDKRPVGYSVDLCTHVANAVQKQLGLADLKITWVPVTPYGLVVRRNDPAFRLVVNRALAELYRSGEVETIYDRWFGAFGKGGEAIQTMYLLNG